MQSRSVEFDNANEVFMECHEQDNPAFGLLACERFWRRWLAGYESGKFVHLRHRTERGKHLFLKMLCRFSPEYRDRLRRKLGWLSFVPFKTFVTLTLDPKRFVYVHDEYEYVLKGWARLRSALRRKYGKHLFLRVLEVTKKGRPHLHILTTIPYIDVVWLRNLWDKHYDIGVQLYVSTVSYNGLSYCLKYVDKGLYDNFYSRLFSSILFASNRRLFSCSDLRSRHPIDAIPQISGGGEPLHVPLWDMASLNGVGGMLEEAPQTKCNKVKALSLYEFRGSVSRCHLDGFLRDNGVVLRPDVDCVKVDLALCVVSKRLAWMFYEINAQDLLSGTPTQLK